MRIKVRYKRPNEKFSRFEGVGLSVRHALHKLQRSTRRAGAPRYDLHSVAAGGRGLELAVWVDHGKGFVGIPAPTKRISKALSAANKRARR